jgi:DNA-binding MarR family transcriptional regulator
MMNDQPPAVLEPSLAKYAGYLLVRAYARAQACGIAAMPSGRHPRDLAILTVLVESGPVSQARLCELLKVNRTIMVKLIDGLEEAGLLCRVRDSGDRRRYALAPTAEGEATLAAMRRAAVHAEAEVAAGLTSAQHARLNRLLSKLLPDLIGELPRSITDRTGFLIAHAHRRLRERGGHALHALGIEPRHFGVLAMIAAAEPCSQQQLATRMGVSGPAIVHTIDELDQGALILRERNPLDRRLHVLRLTDRGRSHLTLARSALDDVQAEIANVLTESGAADLNSLLRKVAAP